jgi:hypothetical protein
METPDLRYPVGKFELPDTISPEDRRKFIEQIAETPARLRAAVASLSDEQLETPYRPEGWTVRQVVHHMPDSHFTSYSRYKLALTEDEPAVKAFYEDRWAELADGRSGPVEVSLRLLECLHSRWVALLRSLTESQWKRAFRHSDLGLVRLDQNAALYAWHGRHHLAHITSLRDRMGWK